MKSIRIQCQFQFLLEKSILYAKITLSENNFVSKLSFKYSTDLLFP